MFLRDGERVYRTYSTQGRGVDGVPLIDLTPYGRQESFEDSPEGWPQRETYSFGRIHDEYTADELAGLAAPSTTGEVIRPRARLTGELARAEERRGRDLNPRSAVKTDNGFRDRRIRPLCHLSERIEA